MSSSSPARLNLEQQRKLAKDLRRAHGAGRADAAVRIARYLPRVRGRSPSAVLAAPFTLSEAQFVVAREAGFASWPDLRRRVAETPSIADAADALVEAALAGDDRIVDTLMQSAGDLTRRSMPAAAVVADTDAISALLESDPASADRPGGARAWRPLLYLCYSTYRRDDAGATDARIRAARMLIDGGANVNATGRETGLPSFNVTLFDQEEWHPLEAAAGRLASPQIVRVLLDAGADVNKAPIVLSQAVRGGSLEVLRQLLGTAPRHWWAVRWALKACVILDRLDMARAIVAATAADDPTQASPDQALLEAIHLGRGSNWIESLLGSDRHGEATMVLRRDAYRAAVRRSHREAADLVRHGVAPEAATPVDRLLGACVTGDSGAVDRILASRPVLSNMFRDDDHRLLSWAIRRGFESAVPLMLRAGLNPGVPDRDGNAPMHLAVRAGTDDATYTSAAYEVIDMRPTHAHRIVRPWMIVAGALAAVQPAGTAQQTVPFEGGNPIAPSGFEPQPIPAEPIEYNTAEVMRIRVVPVARGMVNPWSLAFLPDGGMLVTEKEGRLRIIRNDVLDPKPIPGTPAVRVQGRSGLMDVVLHPQFAANRLIYFTYLKPVGAERQAALTVARGRFDGSAISDLKDIFTCGPGVAGPSRLAWGRDGKLYMTTPSGGNGSSSQDPNTYSGKVLRLNDDGTVPADNPFAGRAGHKPEVYTFGHRNSLGLAVHPATGAIWQSEMGPNGGDEINILKPGANYGWPIVSLGRSYPGPWQSPTFSKEGFESPVVYWMPSVSLSGMVFYTGSRLPKWKGDIFVGGQRTGEIPGTGRVERILVNEKLEELRRESLLVPLGMRIRDVRQGLDELLYVVVDHDSNGGILRIEPSATQQVPTTYPTRPR